MLQAPRSTYRYWAWRDLQGFLRKSIRQISEIPTRYDYRRIYVELRWEGWKIYHKRGYRVYREKD